MNKPTIVTIDLESVLIPELWIEVAEKTGIKELHLTTRDVSDFDKLMEMRIRLLKEAGITLKDIENIIKNVSPLMGAADFLSSLKDSFQVIVLSDSFYELAGPVMPKLGNIGILCHSFTVDEGGFISGYTLRKSGEKEKVVKALKEIGFYVISMGDSFNDIGMFSEADMGLFLNASETVVKQFPQFPLAKNYEEALKIISKERELVLT